MMIKMVIPGCISQTVPYHVILLKPANKSRLEFYEQRGFATSEGKIFYSRVGFFGQSYFGLYYNGTINC